MPGSDDRTDRDDWPEPPEPSTRVRAVVLLVAGTVVVAAALYGALTNDPGTGSSYLFLGAAALGVGMAVREAAQLLSHRRRDRQPRDP